MSFFIYDIIFNGSSNLFVTDLIGKEIINISSLFFIIHFRTFFLEELTFARFIKFVS